MRLWVARFAESSDGCVAPPPSTLFTCDVGPLRLSTTQGTETFSLTASSAADTHRSSEEDRSDKIQSKTGRLTLQIRSRKGGGISGKNFQINPRRNNLVPEVNL
jgi:hypothetical protein